MRAAKPETKTKVKTEAKPEVKTEAKPEYQYFDEDVDALLASAADARQYPVLAAGLAGVQGVELRHEMLRLLAPQVHMRAPRRPLHIMCRLEGVGYEEPVMLIDVSASGVRFLVQAGVPLDVTRSDNMRLHVKTSTGHRTLAVALVRRCGNDERYTDLACRFVTTESDHQQLIAEIRSTIFREPDAEPAATAG